MREKTDERQSAAAIFKKYWMIWGFCLTALGRGVFSVEIYKEEVLNIDPDIKYETQDTLYFAAERIDTLNPADFAE